MSDPARPFDGSHQLTSARQESFAQEYVLDRNASRAARSAGYSVKASNVAGAKLMRDDRVRARIDHLTRISWKKLVISQEETLARICRIARTDVFEVLHAVRSFSASAGRGQQADAPPVDLSCIVRHVSFDADGNIASISLADPLKALELRAKHYELLRQKSDQKNGTAAFMEFFDSLAEKQKELGVYPKSPEQLFREGNPHYFNHGRGKTTGTDDNRGT